MLCTIAAFSQTKKKALLNQPISMGIYGRWVSLEDKQSFIELRKPNLYIDIYGKAVLDTMKFVISTNKTQAKPYTELKVTGKDNTVFLYQIDYLSTKQLSLIYLDRGNTLNYKRVK